LIVLPLMTIVFSVVLTSALRRGPSIESYLSRWALVLVSPEPLMPTTSMPVLAPRLSQQRMKLRPMRPNPLIATRRVMASGGETR
jgi:hypothetical protein